MWLAFCIGYIYSRNREQTSFAQWKNDVLRIIEQKKVKYSDSPRLRSKDVPIFLTYSRTFLYIARLNENDRRTILKIDYEQFHRDVIIVNDYVNTEFGGGK